MTMMIDGINAVHRAAIVMTDGKTIASTMMTMIAGSNAAHPVAIMMTDGIEMTDALMTASMMIASTTDGMTMIGGTMMTDGRDVIEDHPLAALIITTTLNPSIDLMALGTTVSHTTSFYNL